MYCSLVGTWTNISFVDAFGFPVWIVADLGPVEIRIELKPS